MKLKYDLVERCVGGDYMLVPTGKAVGKFNGIFMLTPSAATMFSCIKEGKSYDETVTAVLDEYDTDEETVKKDLDEFIVSLKEKDLIED